VLSPEESEQYQVDDDDDKWEELSESVGYDVQVALRELWKSIANNFTAEL
jgi:hypothetical protein